MVQISMMRQRASALALAIASIAAMPAHAETNAPEQRASNTTEGLQDIVVTAQRKSQDLQAVPIAITAVTTQMMERLNIRNIDKIATVTTGLIYDTGYTFVQTYIRGIGVTNSPGVGLEAPVAIYIDGAYMPRATGTIFDLVDMSSVEVLKGPQGTLYGHNASGGAILLHSADPTNEFSLNLSGEYGRYNHAMMDGVLNVPLSDTLSVRAAGRYRTDDGFIKNLTTNEDVRGKQSTDARIKVKWDPSQQFTAIASFDYHFENGNANASGRQSAVAPFCVGCLFGANPEVAGPYEVTEEFKRHDLARSLNWNLKLTYDFGDVSIESVTNYRNLYG
ncbi:MAG: TonB-dependent receptor plug domain-containing protein, partial [Alphaproteobacteria bacterium]|nr:TonB-dependent receptor plug domain-containing protein [Alphaproteobacteria bacterium]